MLLLLGAVWLLAAIHEWNHNDPFKINTSLRSAVEAANESWPYPDEVKWRCYDEEQRRLEEFQGSKEDYNQFTINASLKGAA